MLRQKVKYHIISIILLLSSIAVFGQRTSNYYPFIKNYEQSEFNAGMQSWMITQAPNGLMYFANDHGLLEFDSKNWNLSAFTGQSIYRSVLATDDGKIYVGSFNNFGYFEADSTGEMVGHSWLGLLPLDERNIEQLWKIHDTDDGMVFQSYDQLIVVKNNEARIYKAPTRFHFSFFVNDKLYVVDENEGVFEFRNGIFIPLKGTDALSGKEVSAIVSYNKNLLIITTNDGAFEYNGETLKSWETPSSSFIKRNQVYCALRIDENSIAFGTIQKGLLICTNEGVEILSIDKTQGLQKNTILCMNLDSNGNLWLGSDNGIDLVYINESLSQINKKQELSSGYSAVVHDDILYLGTNQGVFYREWKTDSTRDSAKEKFKLIQNTKGQVWKLQVIEGVLFCGHNNGTYLIKGTRAELISEVSGGWLYLQSKKHPGKIIAGTYTGLILFEKKDGEWLFSKNIKGFNESSRVMVFDEDENIWMSHGLKGIYHLSLNEAMDEVLDVKFLNSKDGFSSDFGINVSKLGNEIIFPCPDGIYQLDETGTKVKPSDYFNDFFNHPKVNQVIEDNIGNIWYFSKMTINVKQIQRDGSYYDVSLPFKPLRKKFMEGFQFVYTIDSDHTLIGYQDGFIHYNPNHRKDYEKPLEAYINQVKISGSDSILFEGHTFSTPELIPNLEYEDNRLHFSFSAINYEIPDKLMFSTFLEGYDKEWSVWEARQYREFTNLREGKYSFHLRSKNAYDIESNSVVYKFEIKPPWGRTIVAYVVYAILVIILIVTIVYLVRWRMSYLRMQEIKTQKRIYDKREIEAQKNALISEKEIIRLRNDRLREKIKTKDKELANSTMQIIQKNDFLIGLKEFISKNISGTDSSKNISGAKRVVKKIDNELNSEKTWKVFETHFGNVHEEFLANLKKQHPRISPAELRMCACLRMNISSKEIATLLNISLRGVEASRYRLRKSLDLDRDHNLTDFILSM
ncbi:MAG: hypothetical protein OCD76_13265 [Reichenbachiella sp.]